MTTTLKDTRNYVTVAGDGSVTVRPYAPTSSAFDSISLDVNAGVSVGVAELAWNATDGTADLGLKGGTVVLQLGTELLVYCRNNSGSLIANGKAVYVDGTSGDFPTIDLAQADNKTTAIFFGVTTEAIANGAYGFVNIGGKVRGMDTSAIAAGSTAFLSDTVPGGLRATPVTSPNYKARVGVCVVSDASDGVLLVQPSVVPLLKSLSDVTISSPVDQDLLVYNAASAIFENKTPSITSKQSLNVYVDRPVRGKELSILGGMEKLVDNDGLSSVDPLSFTAGCGKLGIAVLAGSDTAGTITITGDTVDRNTGAITASDTEEVTLAGLTTDSSSTDAQSNIIHGFSSLYITTKWFQGAVTITTSDVTLTDVDIYQVAFHQFGDTPTNAELDTFDVTALPTNIAAWLYGYIYALEVTNGTCEVTLQGTISIPAADVDAADVHYRRKIGGIGKTLTPSTDGIWVDLFPGPTNQSYWEDVNVVVIYAATNPLVLS